jgi:FKBP-type peptidyl-prolyl cis-trans isomerase FklB
MMRCAHALLLLAAAAHAGTSPEGKTWLEAKAKEDGVVTLESGLMYKVLRDGDGEEHPKASTSCECHYEGKLTDGTIFDSSYERGSPTSFAPNQVIKGWTEAMQLMVEGDKWEMYIPSELGYGDSGSPPKIPGGAPLVFQMEILKINGPAVPADRCDPATKKGCAEREAAYVDKQASKSKAARAKELKRLRGMKTAGTKPELASWIAKRTKILAKMEL